MAQPLPGRGGAGLCLFPGLWAAAGWLKEGPSAFWGSVWVLQVTREFPTHFLTQTTDPIIPVLGDEVCKQESGQAAVTDLCVSLGRASGF